MFLIESAAQARLFALLDDRPDSVTFNIRHEHFDGVGPNINDGAANKTHNGGPDYPIGKTGNQEKETGRPSVIRSP